MKRYFAIIAAAALLLTGCQSNNVSSLSEESSNAASSAEQTSVPDDTSAESTTAEPAVSSEQPASDAQTAETAESTDSTAFRPGVWRGSNEYFIFHSDSEGATSDFEIGTGVAFECEYGDENIVFHMASSDNNTIAVPSDITEDSVTLTWEDGTEERFVFVSSDDEGFKFYSNGELEQIARRYFKANNPDVPDPELAEVKTNDDGYATVQLYDMEDGNVMTSAWYMLNRVTLTGSDGMTGSAVNMSDFAGEGTTEE